jgi:hypothetical protein
MEQEMSAKRTLSIRISLDGKMDPDAFSNEASEIFNEYLDAILAMDEGDRMTLRDSNKKIVGRAEVTGDEPVTEGWPRANSSWPPPFNVGPPPQNDDPFPDLEINRNETAIRREVLPVENQKFGKDEFAATIEPTQQSSLGAEGFQETLPTDFNSL